MEKFFYKTLKILIITSVLFTAFSLSNRTLAASTAKKYTLLYSGQGGTNVPAKQKFTSTDSYIQLSSLTPRKTGCTFLGWNPNPYSKSVMYKKGGKISNPKKNLTLYAVWKVNVSKVTLNTYSLALQVGESYKLISTVTPSNSTDKTVKYTSRNKNIATVSSNGYITAKKPGKTRIVANCDGKTASCTVTVNPIPVKSLTLDKSSLTLEIEKSQTLKATITPSNATYSKITYSTSNSSIASVNSSGKIVAKKIGTVTITASCDSKVATCRVTVKECTQTNPTTTVNDNSIVKTNVDKALKMPTKEQLKYIINNATILSTGDRKANALAHIDDFMYIQKNYNVNAIFALAVSIQESGVGQSDIAKTYNNWFGIRGGDSWRDFSSVSECIKYFGKLISGNTYFGSDKITPAKIGPTYCDSTWGPVITSHMKSLYNYMK